MQNSTPGQMAAGMKAWQTWHEMAGSAVTDLGAPVDKSITLLSGVATPGKTSITGYTFPQAESLDSAVALMKDHPHFHMPGSSVQILECIRSPECSCTNPDMLHPGGLLRRWEIL